MKKILLLTLSVVFAMGLSAQDKESGEHLKNEFKINPFSFINSTFDISYERLIDHNKSFVLRGAVKYRDSGYDKEVGFMGEVQYRYYLVEYRKTETYPFSIGLYAAPYLFAKTYTDNNVDDYYDYYDYPYYNEQSLDLVQQPYYEEEVTFNSVGGGIYGGLKVLMLKRITMDINVGGGLRITENNADYLSRYSWDVFESGYSGIEPRANFTFGFIF